MSVFILSFLVILWSFIHPPSSEIMVSENDEIWDIIIKDRYIEYKNEEHGRYKYPLGEEALVISSLIGKRSKTEPDSLILILGDHNASYGNRIEIYQIRDKTLKKTMERSFKEMNPWNIKLGDVNGDGINEIGVTMFKKTRFHPVLADRPFIYAWTTEAIVPLWRGSRLAHPFKTYTYYDINKDGMDNLIAIEYLKNDQQIIHAYYWKGFGFESLVKSLPLEEIDDLVVKNKNLICFVNNKELKVEFGENQELHLIE